MTEVVDRQTGQRRTEPQFAGAGLRLLYGPRLLLPLVDGLIARRWFSRLLAWPSTRPASAARIPAFVRTFGIDMSDYAEQDYASFAEFFTRPFRPGARPVDAAPGRLVAPADSKLLAYPVSDDLTFQVKGLAYTLPELLGPPGRPVRAGPASGPKSTAAAAGSRTGGGSAADMSSPRWCLVFRLTVDDGHRYCFVDDCEVVDSYEVPGALHTVGPYSDRKVRVLARNHRVVTRLDTASFGAVTVVEVGAMVVGRIYNHRVRQARRGQEKGWFAYGGSTIVLLVGGVRIDEDIVGASRAGLETKVRLGESVGSRA
ncbi:MAG: phosphatidylserine decarboxylase [Micrococcales bacterium]|nr:phosphatidylserine decarboxylase [Micrococcales bacterium]